LFLASLPSARGEEGEALQIFLTPPSWGRGWGEAKRDHEMNHN